MKTFRKISQLLFLISLSTWFVTAVYLALNFFVAFFVETNPYITKPILAISFLLTLIFGFISQELHRVIKVSFSPDDKKKAKPHPTTKCTSCKKKNENSN